MKPHIYFSQGIWWATMLHPAKEFTRCYGHGKSPSEAFAWLQALEHGYE